MLLRTALLLALSAVPLAAPAQESVHPRPAVHHPVVLGGKPLFALEAGFKTLTPDLRAQAISRRLESLAKGPVFDPASVQVMESEISSDILIGDVLVMSVFESDAAVMGRDRQELAADYAATIRQGIEDYRRRYGPRRTAIGLLLATVTVLLAGLLFQGVSRAGRWAQAALDRRMERLLPAGAPGSLRRLQSHWLQRLMLLGFGLVRLLLQLAILYVAVQLILWFLPWTEEYGFQLLARVRKSLESLGRAALLRGPDLVVLALILLLARYLLRSSRYLFRQVERGSLEIPGFHPYWARPTSKLVTLLLLASAAVAAYPYIPGTQSEAFKGISIFLGVLFSLGSTGVVSNVMAGSVLMYNRAFHQGDLVKIGETMGVVADTNFFVTRLRTFKNVEVSLPNSLIISSQVVNYSHPGRSGGLVIPTAVTIGYDTPWRQVHAMLELAAGRTGGIHREPPPFVLQTALGDFAVTYELNIFIEDPARMPRVLSELHANIQDAFNEYGVQIMSPHYMADRETPALVPRDQWYAAPARPPATDGAR